MGFTQTGSALTCSDTAIALNNVSTSKVKNCQTTVVYNSTSGTDGYGCYWCDKKKAPSGTWYTGNGSVGSPACSDYSGIANCDYPFKTASNTYNCLACKSKYAVANNNLSCVSFTADSNCRHLQSNNTTCYGCWAAYYWDNTKCKLAAKVILAGIMALGALLI